MPSVYTRKSMTPHIGGDIPAGPAYGGGGYISGCVGGCSTGYGCGSFPFGYNPPRSGPISCMIPMGAFATPSDMINDNWERFQRRNGVWVKHNRRGGYSGGYFPGGGYCDVGRGDRYPLGGGYGYGAGSSGCSPRSYSKGFGGCHPYIRLGGGPSRLGTGYGRRPSLKKGFRRNVQFPSRPGRRNGYGGLSLRRGYGSMRHPPIGRYPSSALLAPRSRQFHPSLYVPPRRCYYEEDDEEYYDDCDDYEEEGDYYDTYYDPFPGYDSDEDSEEGFLI